MADIGLTPFGLCTVSIQGRESSISTVAISDWLRLVWSIIGDTVKKKEKSHRVRPVRVCRRSTVETNRQQTKGTKQVSVESIHVRALTFRSRPTITTTTTTTARRKVDLVPIDSISGKSNCSFAQTSKVSATFQSCLLITTSSTTHQSNRLFESQIK